MGEATQAGARGHDAIEHAGVDESVGQDQVTLLGQAAENRGVRGEAGVHHQPMLIPLPGGEGLLELLVDLGVARDERRSGGRGSPFVKRGHAGGDHRRITAETKVIVIGQIDASIGRGAGGQLTAQRRPFALGERLT